MCAVCLAKQVSVLKTSASILTLWTCVTLNLDSEETEATLFLCSYVWILLALSFSVAYFIPSISNYLLAYVKTLRGAPDPTQYLLVVTKWLCLWRTVVLIRQRSSTKPPPWPVTSLPFTGVSTMPRIENDIKLDFKDVLLRPKRSTLKSRSEVSQVDRWEILFRMKSDLLEYECFPLLSRPHPHGHY